MTKTLEQFRAQIDQLDRQILELISERAKCAADVGAYKRENGDGDSDFYRPEREAEVLKLVMERNPGPLPDNEITRIFREIMSACLALEQKMNIAFLGPAGTYTEEAALKHFGQSVTTSAMNSIDEVFREVESGGANFGVVPIENSTEGVITHTLDNFMQSSLKIVGEVELPVHHQLLSTEIEVESIELIYAHQQSLAQCRKWLDANMEAVAKEPVSSNAHAAMLAQKSSRVAAIASRSAAQKYELNILASNIEDLPDNTTRFLIIGNKSVGVSGSDKTSLLVSASNKPGALHNLLEPFAKHNVSMTRIESRPSRGAKWEYVFFLDLDGHCQDRALKMALGELKKEADLVNVLGSYPKAVL
ncbi:MAG: prephenate dehydratase [Pseudomonadota bacterium]